MFELSYTTLKTAEQFFRDLYSITLSYESPSCEFDYFLHVDFDKSLAFEWWIKNRKLAFYILEDNIQCIKVWGPNTQTEMEDKLIITNEDLTEVYKWLINLMQLNNF